MAGITPPPDKMVREIALPDHSVGFFTELVQRDGTRYQNNYPIKRGTLYETVQGGDETVSASFAPLYFLKEIKYGNSDELVIWMWGTDQNAQDSYNSAISYSGDAVANPVYARTYTVRRDVYEATPTIAPGTALTALIAIKVTAGGTGYAKTDTVNISGGGGAAAQLVVNDDGVIQHVIMTNCGSGYDSASLPTITFATTTGAGATAVAVVQTKTAVLVSQQKQELGANNPLTNQSSDSPYSNEYVRLIRIYEVLPGPWLPFTRYDDDLGAIQGQRRAVVNTGQVAALTATSKTTYESRDGSSYVSWEIVETWSNGSGSGPLNPVYPTRSSSERSEAVRGVKVDETSIVVPVGDLPQSGPTIISSRIDAINQFLGVMTTRSVSALPADEVWAYWDYVPIPLLLFDLVHSYYCNNTRFFTLVTNPETGGGSSQLRKHRVTVKYHATYPDTTPNLSSSAYETADVRYEGKVIQFAFNNVLNDALSYDEDFWTSASGSACFWTEAYTFAATTPSATTFAAGAWYTRKYEVEPWGTEGFRSRHIEFYSIKGNPTII